MKALEKIIIALSLPLMLLNVFGGIVSGIWLAILGEWGIIGYGVGILFFGSFALGLAMMPGLLLAAPIMAMGENGNKVAIYFFSFLSALYTMGILSAWCLGLMYFFVMQSDSSSFIPIFIWSYGMATGTIAYMAQKEAQGGDGGSSMVATFFAQLAYVISALITIFFTVAFIEIIILFGVIMFIGLIFQFWTALSIDNNRTYG